MTAIGTRDPRLSMVLVAHGITETPDDPPVGDIVVAAPGLLAVCTDTWRETSRDMREGERTALVQLAWWSDVVLVVQ